VDFFGDLDVALRRDLLRDDAGREDRQEVVGAGGVGRSATMLYQALGILSSSRTNFFLYSLMTYLLSNDASFRVGVLDEDALILYSV
jgi:hypothetical protein